jgi:tetratricopeptide (TPR) repeat protein
LIDRFPAKARIFWLAGRGAYARRDYPAAVSAFRESERLSSGVGARRWLGKALTQLGALDEAEAILCALPAGTVSMDLAWLYERRGDLPRALKQIDKALAANPDDTYARRERQRLQAAATAPEEVFKEALLLRELGEALPVALLDSVFRHLLETGNTADARTFVHERLAELDDKASTRLGWIAYKAEALDLACDLFKRSFARNRSDTKFLQSYERAARNAGRLDELARACEEHAPEVPALWGRAKRLRRSV